MIGVLDRLADIVGAEAFGRLTARELRVLLVLVLHAGRDGIAWPTVATVARLGQVDERHARRALRDLEEAGVIACLHRSRGRVARRYEVGPTAVPGGVVELLTRAEGSRDDPAPVEEPTRADPARDPDPTRADVTRDDPAPVEGPTRADACSNPGQNGPPNTRTVRTPPTPPARGGGSAAPSFEGRKELRDQVLAALARESIRHLNPLRARVLIDGALDEGLELADVPRLCRLAKTQGASPPGLLWHWLEDVHRWRSVLADADLAARERRARLAPSVGTGEDRGPVSLAEAAGGAL